MALLPPLPCVVQIRWPDTAMFCTALALLSLPPSHCLCSYEVNPAAVGPVTNGSWSIPARQIPVEAMYLIFNLVGKGAAGEVCNVSRSSSEKMWQREATMAHQAGLEQALRAGLDTFPPASSGHVQGL